MRLGRTPSRAALLSPWTLGPGGALTRSRRPMVTLASVVKLCGSAPILVAIDMPLSRKPISGRRASDDAVSRAYGSRHCSTHTPSTVRPGRISDDLTQGFGSAGYPLLTSAPAKPPGLVEVYPHPALVEFAGAPTRLKYKAGKGRTYWPGNRPAERRDLLLKE